MKTLDNLIKEITEDIVVKRFKELEKIIDNDQLLNKDYHELLELQKIMINKREKKSKDLDLAINNYENAKENVLKHIILTEYLDLLEEINYDLGLIQKIISQEINIDFE
ncbi:MAG: YlbF family regulator [Candidatus Izimaplasma sp.]|nr:YlbF family regulator [Candidatus Izimaplasma bacterium]